MELDELVQIEKDGHVPRNVIDDAREYQKSMRIVTELPADAASVSVDNRRKPGRFLFELDTSCMRGHPEKEFMFGGTSLVLMDRGTRDMDTYTYDGLLLVSKYGDPPKKDKRRGNNDNDGDDGEDEGDNSNTNGSWPEMEWEEHLLKRDMWVESYESGKKHIREERLVPAFPRAFLEAWDWCDYNVKDSDFLDFRRHHHGDRGAIYSYTVKIHLTHLGRIKKKGIPPVQEHFEA